VLEFSRLLSVVPDIKEAADHQLVLFISPLKITDYIIMQVIKNDLMVLNQISFINL
jgi:hypothetical protein